jgi:hypothetical protein
VVLKEKKQPSLFLKRLNARISTNAIQQDT